MGAAGRDFHDFLTIFKDNKEYEVVAFTAEQIPGIEKRRFPKQLAGKRYKKGIPIYPERILPKLIKELNVDEVILSYSDLKHEDVMHKASMVLAAGANFKLLSYKKTSLKSKKKIISVCAVRTGCGKSQISRRIATLLKRAGKKVVVVRHPMPYGNLVKQRVQRFASMKDLDKANCTIEEREDYEPHIKMGSVVYAGVDYKEILKRAEKEADIILWDGGNNDVPFYKSDLHIVVTDPFRANHEYLYHPGEENFRLADVVVINKINDAPKSGVNKILNNIKILEKETGKKITIIKTKSIITVDKPELIKNKKVLVVEDGPTLTHGGMSTGAGTVMARKLKARIVDPKKYAVGSLKEIYKKYPHLDKILPAIGYGRKQISDFKKTIEKIPCDSVIDGSPFDLFKLLKIKKPVANVSYESEEVGINLKTILKNKKFI
ncbi:MAG: GTPase [Candidatus Nanoarchaeia archaeon]|nr:GTPase [Candidatus Nanoarchaeia archaeon]